MLIDHLCTTKNTLVLLQLTVRYSPSPVTLNIKKQARKFVHKHGKLMFRQSQIQRLTPGALLAAVLLGKAGCCTAEEPCCVLAAT